MSSWNSVCSSLRCSVASATDLSSSAMPASSAAISEVSVVRPSFAASMAVSSSDTARSRAFFLSSLVSSCLAQYSFLCSSSACSFFSASTMPSIILITLSKPPLLMAFLPLSASTMKSRLARSRGRAAPSALRSEPRARERSADMLEATWTKLALVLGSVFLKSSRASSSFRTLMVSARATNSSARVFDRSSHSAVFVSQLPFSSARNFVSSAREACVSERSDFMFTICTPSSPICVVLLSMDAVSAAVSFVLAAISSS
mmetsp:Transcript_102391/g.320147  ORF Transcript_102391/g.320147 Transcript_102391/m.320147 type:complete len:259 (-) Transcript_102391:252-1028(-)